MTAVCGDGAAQGKCGTGLSVVQQLSTMPSWMYADAAVDINTFPLDPWNTTNPFSKYSVGSKLADDTCVQMARYFSRFVGWYTRGGFHDECHHWHASGLTYDWWGLSILNEDEHHVKPDDGSAYTKCYDAVSQEVKKVNSKIVMVGPEICCRGTDYLMYFLNGSNHADGKPPPVASYHQAPRGGHNTSAASFFTSWDDIYASYVLPVDRMLKATGQTTQMVLNEFIPFVGDWCDCKGVEHLCGGERYPTACPDWQNPATAGGDPNLQSAKGVGMNKATWSWHAAAGVFAYGYGTLAELKYKLVGQDQLVGGTWPDNEPAVSCIDWQSGKLNAKYYVTTMLAKTIGSSKEKVLYSYNATVRQKSPPAAVERVNSADVNVNSKLYALPYTMSGTQDKNILLVNKEPRYMTVHLTNVKAGTATVVEVRPGDPEVALLPPIELPIGPDGSVRLGPFATAVVTLCYSSACGVIA